MSRHTHMLIDDTLFVYGVDLCTGGFFYQYLDPVLGQAEDNDGLVDERDALTLSALLKVAKEKYDLVIAPKELVSDYLRAEKPSPMQYNVNTMFGIDLKKRLIFLDEDMFANFGEYMSV